MTSQRLQRVSHYTIVKQLGEGGMGVVFEAVDDNTGRTVVIKAIRGDIDPSPDAVRRFEREGRAGALVKHENVVTILDGGKSPNGQPYLVFEHLAGGGLDRRLKKEGPLPWREVATLGAAIARGLAAIHAQGLVHRDMKPANVLITADGVPKISDLGLVRADKATGLTQGGLTKTGEMLGTLYYIAPEQVDQAKDVDARADLYSLGCMLHALVAGNPPFDGTQMILVKKHLMDPPPPLSSLVPDVPAELEALVLKLLAKDPAQRVQTATEVAEALDRLVQGPGTPVRRRGPALIVGGLIALLAVGGAAAWGLGKEPPTTTETAPVAPTSDAPVKPVVADLRTAARFEVTASEEWVAVEGSPVSGIVVLRDRERAVLGSRDANGTVRVWRTRGGQPVGPPTEAGLPIAGLAPGLEDRVVGVLVGTAIRRWTVRREGDQDTLWLDPTWELAAGRDADAGLDSSVDAIAGPFEESVLTTSGTVVRRMQRMGWKHQAFEMGQDLAAMVYDDKLASVRFFRFDLLLSASPKLGVRLWRVPEDPEGSSVVPDDSKRRAELPGARSLTVHRATGAAFAGTGDGGVHRLTIDPEALTLSQSLVLQHAGPLVALALSPDATFGVSASAGSDRGPAAVRVWDARVGSKRRPVELPGLTADPTAIAWGGDGWFLVGFSDGRVRRVELTAAN